MKTWTQPATVTADGGGLGTSWALISNQSWYQLKAFMDIFADHTNFLLLSTNGHFQHVTKKQYCQTGYTGYCEPYLISGALQRKCSADKSA